MMHQALWILQPIFNYHQLEHQARSHLMIHPRMFLNFYQQKSTTKMEPTFIKKQKRCYLIHIHPPRNDHFRRLGIRKIIVPAMVLNLTTMKPVLFSPCKRHRLHWKTCHPTHFCWDKVFLIDIVLASKAVHHCFPSRHNKTIHIPPVQKFQAGK